MKVSNALRNNVVQAVVGAILAAVMTSIGWLYQQTSANTTSIAGQEQRITGVNNAVIEIQKDVREIREWTRKR